MNVFRRDSAHLWFTLGPSTDDDNLLREIFNHGATGCRLTFSYGTPTLQEERARRLKSIALNLGKQCFVVADLAGDKFRLGDFEEAKVQLTQNQVVTLGGTALEKSHQELRIPVNVPRFFTYLHPGDCVTVGDGSVALEIITVDKLSATARVLVDGIISPNRGLMVEGIRFDPQSLTPLDKQHLHFIAESEVFDGVILSFVSSAADIDLARRIMSKSSSMLPVIAKIETPRGLNNLFSIVAAADMVVAARGDLAQTQPWVELPAAVQSIHEECQKASKPWILATQIVEGMERFYFPTRAEICDLGNWLNKGASGVILSYETAFGKRPLESVTAVAQMLARWGRI